MAEQRSTAVATRASRPRAPRPPKPPKPPTPTQRKTRATQLIMQALGASDQEAVIIAALEAVSERWAMDATLQQSLRQKYGEVRELRTASVKPKVDARPMPQPKPSAHLATHNPLANLSPYQIADAYEHRDFRAVLEHAGRDLLREMVGVVKAREPKSKQPNKNSMPAMINYIVEHVLGPGY